MGWLPHWMPHASVGAPPPSDASRSTPGAPAPTDDEGKAASSPIDSLHSRKIDIIKNIMSGESQLMITAFRDASGLGYRYGTLHVIRSLPGKEERVIALM